MLAYYRSRLNSIGLRVTLRRIEMMKTLKLIKIGFENSETALLSSRIDAIEIEGLNVDWIWSYHHFNPPQSYSRPYSIQTRAISTKT